MRGNTGTGKMKDREFIEETMEIMADYNAGELMDGRKIVFSRRMEKAFVPSRNHPGRFEVFRSDLKFCLPDTQYHFVQKDVDSGESWTFFFIGEVADFIDAVAFIEPQEVE